jgi:hypothetical protein
MKTALLLRDVDESNRAALNNKYPDADVILHSLEPKHLHEQCSSWFPCK